MSMTGETILLEAYQDWRRLAELEGEAIRTRDWTLMADCQQRLSGLQPRILRLTDQAREEWRQAGVDPAEKKTARTHLSQMDLARQNLKRVHRSYSPASPAVWNSFS
jgi:hypothetical protein